MKKRIISLLSIIGLTGVAITTFIACNSSKTEDVITLDANGGKIEDSDASSLKLEYEKNETWSDFYIANKYIGATKKGYDFICWTLDGKTPISNDYVFTKPVTLKPLYVKNRDCITIACRYLDDNFVDFTNDYSISFSWPDSLTEITATVEYAINDGDFQTYNSELELNNKLNKTGDYFSFKSDDFLNITPNLAGFKILCNDHSIEDKNMTRFAVSGPIDALNGEKEFIEEDAFRELFNACSGICSSNGLDLARRELKKNCYDSLFYSCNNLVYAPKLPATILAEGCYSRMFYHCPSLINAPSLPSIALAERCYVEMFAECTSLVKAPSLLPATTLQDRCYMGMFKGCTSLEKAPILPAKSLTTRCYYSMFDNCKKLTKAPELPATVLADECYSNMFQHCKALTTMPTLPTSVLIKSCYQYMFYDCTALVNITKLPATTVANNCYEGMFENCTALVNAPEMMFKDSTSATEVCAYMFKNCSSLKFVKLNYEGALSQLINSDWLSGTNRGSIFFNGSFSSSDIPTGWTVYRF